MKCQLWNILTSASSALTKHIIKMISPENYLLSPASLMRFLCWWLSVPAPDLKNDRFMLTFRVVAGLPSACGSKSSKTFHSFPLAALVFIEGHHRLVFHCHRLSFIGKNILLFAILGGELHLKTRIDYHEAHFDGRSIIRDSVYQARAIKHNSSHTAMQQQCNNKEYARRRLLE